MDVNIDDLLNATHEKPIFVETGVPAHLQCKKMDHFPVYTERTFEDTLDRLCGGESLKSICEDPTMPQDVKTYRRWILRDPERKDRYYEAQEIGVEAMTDDMVAISDGEDAPMEDIARSNLRVSTRKWLAGCRNRSRYGQKKEIDANITIDLTKAIEQATQRVIDVTPDHIRTLPSK